MDEEKNTNNTFETQSPDTQSFSDDSQVKDADGNAAGETFDNVSQEADTVTEEPEENLEDSKWHFCHGHKAHAEYFKDHPDKKGFLFMMHARFLVAGIVVIVLILGLILGISALNRIASAIEEQNEIMTSGTHGFDNLPDMIPGNDIHIYDSNDSTSGISDDTDPYNISEFFDAIQDKIDDQDVNDNSSENTNDHGMNNRPGHNNGPRPNNNSSDNSANGFFGINDELN